MPTGASAKGKHLLRAFRGLAVVGAGTGDQDCWVCVRLQMQRKLKGRAGVRSSIRVFECLLSADRCLREVVILSFFQVGAALHAAFHAAGFSPAFHKEQRGTALRTAVRRALAGCRACSSGRPQPACM